MPENKLSTRIALSSNNPVNRTARKRASGYLHRYATQYFSGFTDSKRTFVVHELQVLHEYAPAHRGVSGSTLPQRLQTTRACLSAPHNPALNADLAPSTAFSISISFLRRKAG